MQIMQLQVKDDCVQNIVGLLNNLKYELQIIMSFIAKDNPHKFRIRLNE